MVTLLIQTILFIIIMAGHIYLWNLPRSNRRENEIAEIYFSILSEREQKKYLSKHGKEF